MTSVDGSWDTIIVTPMGKRRGILVLTSAGDRLNGTYSGDLGGSEISDGRLEGDKLSCSVEATRPLRMAMAIEATINGDALEGTVRTSSFGAFKFSGVRA